MALFEWIFNLDGYDVILRNHSVIFQKDNNSYRIPSDFQNEYDIETGIIIIQNRYMQFRCVEEYQRQQMFDFIARGFNIEIITENKKPITNNPPA